MRQNFDMYTRLTIDGSFLSVTHNSKGETKIYDGNPDTSTYIHVCSYHTYSLFRHNGLGIHTVQAHGPVCGASANELGLMISQRTYVAV